MNTKKIKKIIQEEINKHLDSSIWEVIFFRSAEYLGTTTCYKDEKTKQVASGLIRINELVIEQNNLKTVLDVVRHEIAHALDGNRNGHNKKFREICRKVGTTDSMATSQSIYLKVNPTELAKLRYSDALWEIEGSSKWISLAAFRNKKKCKK